MTPSPPESAIAAPKKRIHPFRSAVLRGLAIVMPPLLTIVLFIWAWSIIEHYVLVPVEGAAEHVIVSCSYQTLAEPPADLVGGTKEGGELVSFKLNNRLFTRASERDWLFGRYDKGDWVGRYSSEYVKREHLQRWIVLPMFLSVFLLILYFLGKFVVAGVGHFFVGLGEALIRRLPLINNVYSSVKQVTDFVFSEREIEFNRVVAVEYPRKGVWSVGFVTGESMLDIAAVANEPVLSVLMPTSPMPATGFTITVRKSEAVDLNITVDQAIQFIVSCGVVIPPQQIQKASIPYQISAVITNNPGGNGQHGNGENAEQQTEGSVDAAE
ncbi:MAG: DUF502 domain-containing protein [Pirellulaceae bacterium]|nr:DUF502 domain-containing protein [Pirellulaceae bacterium]HJN07518.1 DUF502 domain-containing protein [Pirellulaceae bacterium]